MQNHLPAKLLAEFIGTFAFVFIGAGAAAVVGTGAGLNGISAIALAHGLTSWSLPLRMAASQAPVSGRLHHSHGEHCDDHRPGQLV